MTERVSPGVSIVVNTAAVATADVSAPVLLLRSCLVLFDKLSYFCGKGRRGERMLY